MPPLKRVFLLALLTTMEVLAGFAVVVGSSLLDALSPGYAMFWVLLGSALAGLVFGLLISLVGLRDPWNRVVLVVGVIGVGAVSLLAISRNVASVVIALFLVAVLYWRGIVVTQEPVDHDDVLRRFGWGFGFLFFGIVWVLARGILNQQPIWQMIAIVGIGYTVVGMLALGTSRLEQHREPGAASATTLALVIQLALVAAVGFTALQIFSLDMAGAVGHLLQPLFNRLGDYLYNVALLFASPIQHFVDLVKPTGRRTPRVNTGPTGLPGAFAKRPKEHQPANSPYVIGGLLVVAAAVVGATLWVIWRSLPRLPKRRLERGFTEQRRDLLSLRDVWTLMFAWLRGLFARGTAATEVALQRARRRVSGDYPADPVRRVYAQLLRRATRFGLARPEAATPFEYATLLAARWPQGASDFDLLTEGYVQRRYAEVEMAQGRVAEIQQSWQRVRPVMRAPLRDRDPDPQPSATELVPRITWQQRLRRAIVLPEPAMGTEVPRLRGTLALAVFSFLLPVAFIIALVIFLALISGNFGSKHGLPAVPVPGPSWLALILAIL